MNRHTRLVLIASLILVLGMVGLSASTQPAYGQAPAPDLTIGITQTPVGGFIVGSTGQYTMTVTNGGTAPTTGAITVTITLSPGFGYLTAGSGGGGWTCPGGNLPPLAISQQIACTNPGPINVGTPVNFPIVISLNHLAPPSKTTNVSVADAVVEESNTANNSASISTSVQGVPDMAITKIANPTTFVSGTAASYTLGIINNGSLTAPVASVIVDDTIISGSMTITGASGAGWNCVPINATHEQCTNTVAIPVGPAGNITVNVLPSAAGSVQNQGVVQALGEPATLTSDNSVTLTTTVAVAPDLTITKAAVGAPFTIGTTGGFLLTVTNNGSGATTGTITVTDVLPANLTLASFVSSTDFVCSGTTTVTCTKNTPLGASPASATITLTVNVLAGTPASISNTATVQTFGDPNSANDTSNTVVVAVNILDISVVKSHNPANFLVGGVGPFTLSFLVQNTVVSTGPTVGNITLVDVLPVGLTYAATVTGAGWACPAPVGQTVTCTYTGAALAPGASTTLTFNVTVLTTAAASTLNTATVSTPGDAPTTGNNTSTDTITVLRPDLAITKSHPPSFAVSINGDYTIGVTNVGTGDTTGTITVTDTLPASFTVVAAAGTGWACPIVLQTVTCTRASPATAGNPLPNITITVTPTAQGSFTNTALVANGSDITTPVNGGNNTVSDPTTVGAAPPPDFSILKSHTNPMTVGASSNYTITVTNVGLGSSVAGQTTSVVDTIPASFTVGAVTTPQGAWTCGVSGQIVTCTRADAIPGNNTVLTAITIPVTPTTILGQPFNNQAVVSNPGDTNVGNDIANDSTNVIAPNAPDLAITKTHATNFTVGVDGTYTITVSNQGTVAAPGPVTVTENLPATFNLQSTGGTGWTCTPPNPVPGPQPSFNCTHAGPVAANGGTLPALTIVARATTVTGSPFTNNANVAPETGTLPPETNVANNAANDPTTVTAAVAPDMMITKSHTGNFTAGTPGTFTLSVQNIGTVDTSGTMTVTDNMPTGLTYVSGVGFGWTCNTAPATAMTCTNPTAFVSGAAASTITLTVNVAASAPGSIINTANVTAPTGDPNTINNTGSDTVVVNGVVDLQMTKTHAGNFQVGVNGVYTLSIANIGGQASTGTTTVTDVLPAGLVPIAASGIGWNCPAPVVQTVTCTRATAISGGQTTTITVTVNVTAAAGSAPQPIPNTATLVNASDSNGANNSSTDPTFVTPPNTPDLAITKSHSGSFVAGQNGTYTLTVSNVGTGPTGGATVVSDTLPAGVTFVLAGSGGSGFSCSAVGQAVTCNNPSAIGAGSNLPVPIVVSISASVGQILTNAASVNIPAGDPNTGNNSSNTDTVTVQAAPLVSAANSTINVFPTTVNADGITSTTITVTLRDTTGVVAPNKQVNLTTDTGIPPGLFISSGGVGTTNGSGVVTFTATSSVPQTVNFVAQVGPPDNVNITNGTRTANFVSATGLSSTLSTASANPGTVAADNSATSTISGTIRTNLGVGVDGVSVTLSGSPNTGITVSPGSTVTTSGGGNYSFTVKSTTVQNTTFTITATNGVSSITLSTQPTVNFTGTGSSAFSASTSSFVSSHISIPADNITTATLTATIRNSSSGVLSGVTVTVSNSPALSGMTVTPNNSGITDSNGVATFTVRSVTQGGPITYTGSVGGTAITQTAQLSFTAPGTAAVVNSALAGTPGTGTPGTGTPGLAGVALLAPPSNGPNIGIVIAYRLRVRTGPSLRYPVIGFLKLRTRVILVARVPRGTWFMIQLENGQMGWVSSGYIRVARLAFRHLPIIDPRTLPPPGAAPTTPIATPTPTKVPGT